jgi:2',3'-cyclic-nucleotide 2'-phosphodiesterase (5'-nucleotidase family)
VLGSTDLGATLVPRRRSYGVGGTCAGIAAILDDERDRQPTVWLDAGDLTVGPAGVLLGARPWADLARLPVAAAATGNHEFDDGVPALLEAARRLPYPLLCANVDVGLPASALVDTGAGPLGVIGLTHPHSHLFSQAPPPIDGWADRVGALAAGLRRDGARWVVVLLHDGVDWWPTDDRGTFGTRSDRLAAVAAPWAPHADLILGGHTPGAWIGELGGTPAAHPHLFAASVVVVDVLAPPARPVIRGVYPVPAVPPTAPSAATDALEAAADRVVARTGRCWLGRTGASAYLPDLVAAALRVAGSADAGLAPASQHTTQGALDGAVAALGPGPVTELDLMELFGFDDDRPAVVGLRPGEFGTAVDRFHQVADPASQAGDRLWWNWCRMPPGTSTAAARPSTVAVLPHMVPRLAELLGRDLDTTPGPTGAREALCRVLGRQP